MQNKFIQYIQRHKLFFPEDKILLGVSGGMDSVAMCRLFAMSGFNFSIAHCNFGLRGGESDDDEKFVKEVAGQYKVNFYSIRFDTEKDPALKKNSIQMAARHLRYGWLEKIRQEHGYQYISVAHHSNDDLETFFINLLRGTGIAGLSGIRPKNGWVVRPMLFASRNEIENFVHAEKLDYREDSSNLSQKYLRNKIRHSILPLLKEINPSITETVKSEIQRLRDVNTIYAQAIEEKKRKLFFHSADGNSFSIYIHELRKLEPLETWMYEFFSPYRFNMKTIGEIIASFDSIPGKQFLSGTHRVVKDRELLIISPLPDNKNLPVLQISPETLSIYDPFFMRFEQIEKSPGFKIPSSPGIASFDLGKIEFPLKIRKWAQGDRFIPIGMKGFKKISDFLIDVKVPLSEKEKVYVLISGDDIIWVIGYRLDDRFKISDNTRKIFKVEAKKI